MAQRMVRTICPNCKEKQETPKEQLIQLGVSETELDGFQTYHGRGCVECNNMGYRGRTGLFEVMAITPGIERLILNNVPTTEIADLAIKENMLTLRMAGIDKIRKGITTVEQVLAETT